MKRNEFNTKFFDQMIAALNFFNDSSDTTDKDVSEAVDSTGTDVCVQMIEDFYTETYGDIF